jgi:hypothetical protein
MAKRNVGACRQRTGEGGKADPDAFVHPLLLRP